MRSQAGLNTAPAVSQSPPCSPHGTRCDCETRREQFERLAFHQRFVRHIVEHQMREIGLAGHRAQGSELRTGKAHQIVGSRVRVRHGLQARLVGRSRNALRRPELGQVFVGVLCHAQPLIAADDREERLDPKGFKPGYLTPSWASRRRVCRQARKRPQSVSAIRSRALTQPVGKDASPFGSRRADRPVRRSPQP